MLSFTRKIILPLLCVATFFSVGCSANNDSPAKQNCIQQIWLNQKLPELVLVGTDLVNLDEFSVVSNVSSNEYSADIGGAILSLSTKLSDGKLEISRTFHEPGEKVNSQTYICTCLINGTFYSEDLIGKFVESGIVVLEVSPQINGIPDNLWVFYKNIRK